MNQEKKTLFLSQPYLILMVGTPGAGKTFFAKQFSATFNAPFVNINKIRHDMFDHPDFSRDQEEKLEQFSHYLVEEIMRTKKTIIVEGKLDARIDRQEFVKLAEKNGYKTLIVWAQTVEAVAKNRAIKNLTKDKDFVLSEDDYQKIVGKFTSPNAKENPVVISGKHTFATQAKTVLKRIADLRYANSKITRSSSRTHLIR